MSVQTRNITLSSVNAKQKNGTSIGQTKKMLIGIYIIIQRNMDLNSILILAAMLIWQLAQLLCLI